MSDTLTTALERSAQPKEAQGVVDLIERQTAQIEKVLPGQAERFKRVALTEIRRTPKLVECAPESLLGALMLCAQLGLEPGPLGHAYFVPFKREVVFIVGYKGIVKLAYDSQMVKDIDANVVHEGDAFDFHYGTSPRLVHTPSGPPGERPWTHAYAVARLTTRGQVFNVIYPEDVEKAKERSANASNPASPWQTDYFAMVRKTAVRRLAPMLPQSPVFAQALGADDQPVEAR